jgi:hypothetical protein
MASRIAEAYVQIVPRIDGIGSGLTKGLSKDMGTAGEESAKGFANNFKKVLGPALALAAVAAVGSFVKASIEAGEKAATANARIEQIAKSMDLFGSETGTVTKRLQDLAKEQALATGVDQNAIKATQAKLLTFKELGKTAGDLGGSFDRATGAALDLAAAGFGSAETNAVQLGKALQDPIKGITALARSGVTFTEQEKEKIKTLTESGQILEAQNLILSAIESQVGGTAIATANASDRMNVAFGLLTEKVGLALLPVFNALGEFVINQLVPGLESLFDFISTNADVIAVFVGVLGTLLIAFNAVRIAAAAWAVVQGILNLVLSLNPISLVILAIAALVAAIVFVATRTRFFQDVWAAMTTAIRAAWDATVNFFDTSITATLGFFDKLFTGIKTVFTDIANFITGIANGIIATIEGMVNFIINGMNALINALNSLSFSVPAWVPVIGGKSFSFNLSRLANVSLGRIPALAEGGFVTGPTTALIGEAGPEVVIPLSRFEDMMGLGERTSGRTINYYAAENKSVDSEQALLQAIKRAKVITGW